MVVTPRMQFEFDNPPLVVAAMQGQHFMIETRPPRMTMADMGAERGRDGRWRPFLRGLYFDGVLQPMPEGFGLGKPNSADCEDTSAAAAMFDLARRCNSLC